MTESVMIVESSVLNSNLTREPPQKENIDFNNETSTTASTNKNSNQGCQYKHCIQM